MANWHGQSAGQVLTELESSRERGLSRDEAEVEAFYAVTGGER